MKRAAYVRDEDLWEFFGLTLDLSLDFTFFKAVNKIQYFFFDGFMILNLYIFTPTIQVPQICSELNLASCKSINTLKK